MTTLTRRTILSACSGTVLAATARTGVPRVQFESEPRMVTAGRSPKLLTRRQHGLQMLTTRPSAGGKGFDLIFTASQDLGDSWSEPLRVNSVAGEVSDHGENSPFLLSSPDGSMLYAVWNARQPGETGASHLRFARSPSMQPRWTEAVTVNDHRQPISHSFQGAAVGPDGAIYVAWLDARDSEHAGGHHGHTGGTSGLYVSRSSDAGGTWTTGVRVAQSVCPCCRASIAFTGDRVHVSWRGVDTGDLRDIYIANSVDKGATWGQPVAVSRDGWKINGCPHVGASLAAIGDTLYAVWFTEAGDKPGIYMARSSDGGERFSAKQLLSAGTTDPTHPQAVSEDGKLAIVFQARDAAVRNGWGKMAVFYREVSPAGVSPLVRVPISKGNAVYPSVALGLSGRIFVSWTETGESGASAMLVRGRR
ncbi:MAG TPA: sialidase family protein [Bryobacteraceae bacterium]|nr:sialidase family protein [Bryobacteraceae bacterium]